VVRRPSRRRAVASGRASSNRLSAASNLCDAERLSEKPVA
jgi:hypothetical protein